MHQRIKTILDLTFLVRWCEN